MSNDYGVRGAKRRSLPFPPWLLILVIVLGLAAFAANLVYQSRKQTADLVATAKAWTVAGPPCPSVSAEAFAAMPMRHRIDSDFEGVHLTRVTGQVACSTVVYDGGRGDGDYPVCQLSSPAMLAVTTAKGSRYFVPGEGARATISVPHGEVRCVAATNLTSW